MVVFCYAWGWTTSTCPTSAVTGTSGKSPRNRSAKKRKDQPCHLRPPPHSASVQRRLLACWHGKTLEMQIMKKQLIYNVLASASLVPVVADAHGFGFGRGGGGAGGVLVVLFMVVLAVAVIGAISASASRPDR